MVDQLKGTKILPPEMAVSLVWGRSNLLSGSEEVREVGNDYLEKIQGIKKRAEDDPDELRYIETAMAYMDATFRNIVTIIRGRNLNFKQAEKLHESQQKSIDNYKTFSSDLQSLGPRLSGMMIGGVSLSAILEPLLPEFLKNIFGTYTIHVLFAFCAALSYVVYGWKFVPWISQLKEKEKIKTDYDRNLYYAQYLANSKVALSSLYRRLEDLHYHIFNQKYNDKARYTEIISDILRGIEPTMCEFATDCIPTGIVAPDKWSMCETGQNLDKCRIRQEKLT